MYHSSGETGVSLVEQGRMKTFYYHPQHDSSIVGWGAKSEEFFTSPSEYVIPYHRRQVIPYKQVRPARIKYLYFTRGLYEELKVQGEPMFPKVRVYE